MQHPTRRRFHVVALVGVGLVAGLLLPVPMPSYADDPPAPVVLAPVDDLVCPNLFGYKDNSLKRKTARAVMTGVVDMDEYGSFTVPVDPMTQRLRPTWRTQATLDLAGNRYVDSLSWTLPLLRVGLDLQAKEKTAAEGIAMTAQFVALARQWVAVQPAPGKRGVWVNHPQYGGFRLGVFTCAVRELPDPVDNAWMVEQTRAELAVQLGGFSVSGANNTMLNSQLAAYAAAHEVGTPGQRAQARANVLALVARLTYADGSDREGAPGYGVYLATIEARTAAVMEQYGARTDAATVRATLARTAGFAAAASRPDRRLETIGDTQYRRIPATLYGSGSPATWVATSGEEGSKPADRFSRWTGGYVFGRSGWVAGTDEESTFYSVRTAATAPNTAHRHSDTTSVTWFSRGVSWVADPGPYRYDTSALRAHVRTRSAHSAFVAKGGGPAFLAPARWVRTRSGGGIDTTCVRDRSYEASARVQVVRCVYYVRSLDALVVHDVVRPTAKRTEVRQQFILPPEVTRARAQGRQVALDGVTGTQQQRSATVSSTRTTQVKKAKGTRAMLGRDYGVREAGRLLRIPWSAPVGLTSSTTTVLSHGAATVTVAGSSLRIATGGQSVVVPMAFTRFPRPKASVSLKATPARLVKGKKAVLKGKLRAAGRRLPGTVLTVQQQRGNGWKKVATTRTDGKGRYSLKLRGAKLGTAAYRVKVAGASGAAGWKKATAKAVKVTVVKRKHR